jgi:hypothetical protein
MAKNLKALFALKRKLPQVLKNIQKEIAVTALNHYKGKFTEGNLFYSNVPYARRHNEGLKGMPKRQFLGMERALKPK